MAGAPGATDTDRRPTRPTRPRIAAYGRGWGMVRKLDRIHSRLCFSYLNDDKDCFLQICRHPCLALAVKAPTGLQSLLMASIPKSVWARAPLKHCFPCLQQTRLIPKKLPGSRTFWAGLRHVLGRVVLRVAHTSRNRAQNVSGLVDIKLEPGKKIEHLGVKVELLGQIGNLQRLCI